MEEFFPEWNKAAVTNYGGLGLGSVDVPDDQFDIELDEILKEYNDLSGDTTTNNQEDSQDRLYDSQVSSVATECIADPLYGDISTAAVTPEPVLDPKLTRISGLASLVEELSDELEILLFYHRKCYIKNLSNSNYLRQTPKVPFSQVALDFKRKFKVPYITAKTENGSLAIPSSDCGQRQFPFFHKEILEWKPCDLHKLEICVINSFYHRQLFFIDGRFQQMLVQMGFTLGDLSQIQNLKLEMDKELWNLLSTDRFTEATRIEKYQNSLHKFMREELKLIDDLVVQHTRDQKPVFPLVLRGGDGGDKNKDKSCSVLIDLKDLIAWKQHEAKRLYLKRIFHEGYVDIKDVDWLMVSKGVFFCTGRTESSEQLKNIYRYCKSSEFNNNNMSTKELNNLKLVISSQRHSCGIDWTTIAKQLGTNRSPIRLFQTYTNFISITEANSFLNNYDDKLAAFLHIKKYVGHIPRIVHRLQQKFGPVHYVTFGTTWQDINPRFAIGNFFIAEDAALLVVMELHREALVGGKKFSVLQFRLPWRHCSVWRKRAANIFWNLEKWTFEEDQLLLYAVRRYGVEWNGLPKLFPYRPKYAILVRYHLIQKKILSGVTLSQYHSIYFRRMSKSNLIRLTKIADLFRRVIGEPSKKYKGVYQEVPDISGNIEHDDDDDDDDDDKESNSEEEMEMTLPSIKTELGPIRIDSHPTVLPKNSYLSSATDVKPSSSSSSSTIITSKSTLDLDCDAQNLELLQSVLISSGETSQQQQQLLQPLENVCDWKTPTEKNVIHYLTTFDKNIVVKALQRLESYIASELQAEGKDSSDSSKSSRLVLNCDRRKFDRDDPVSVASALQLRRVELKPITREVWKSLNQFEKTVCQAVRSFSSCWRTKKGASRPYIPTDVSLSFLPSIRNIIKNPRELAPVDPPSHTLSIESGSSSHHQPLQGLLKQEPYKYEEMFPSTAANSSTTTTTIDPESETNDNNDNNINPTVEIVQPTSFMIEARNNLCRAIWNNNNTVKVKKKSVKERRRALNHAAARARWEKQTAKDKEKLEKEELLKQDERNKKLEKRPMQTRWYDSLLTHSGVDYEGGFEHLLYVDEVVHWEDMDGTTTGGPDLLTVLHDHSYAKGYVPNVQKVVDDIRSTFSKLHAGEDEVEEGDSAKENAPMNEDSI